LKNKKSKVLVVDNETSIRRILEIRLSMVGYEVVTAGGGLEALDIFHKEVPDLVVLDVMLPKLDGYGVCQKLRQESNIPIIMLTALGDVADRLMGLELGADDYVCKPFSPKELEARICALLRRVEKQDTSGILNSGVVNVDTLQIDTNKRQVYKENERIRLTGREFSLLEMLVSCCGRTVSRSEILEKVWGYNIDQGVDMRIVDVHVSRLRANLEKDPKKILLVEDDDGAALVLKNTLTTQHYLVDLAMDGLTGLSLAEAFAYDIVLLDVMLPKLDGLEFCRQLRQSRKDTPILLMTALDSSTSKVIGLDAGADDYLVKPFDINELLARIRALVRRGSTVSSVIEVGNLKLDFSSCRVSYNGQLLHLTAKEYALLELLLRNSHRIFSQRLLLDYLWLSDEEIPSENTVRAHIKTLRRKLKQAGADGLIETVYGLGYRLRLGEDEKDQPTVTVHSQPTSSDSVTVKEETQPQTSSLAAIWERFKPKYSDRVTVLEEAIKALVAGTLTQEVGQQVQREAHLLIGSLASFGFAEASRLSREIEQIFSG